MSRVVVFILFYLLFIRTGIAQYYYYNDKYYATDLVWELGLGTGLINSLTDIGGREGNGRNFIKDLNRQAYRPYYNFHVGANYKDAIAIRLNAGHGKIVAADSMLPKSDNGILGRYARNLSFSSQITEIQWGIEIHPLSFYLTDKASRCSPYVHAGLGIFHFNPKAKLDGVWYALQPLRLEGQGFAEYPERKIYKLQQLNIPLGAGIKYELSACINMRFEFIHHILFTDYLDDVSTSYIDPALFYNYLQPAYAAIASRLYSRMQELQPGYRVTPEMTRGNKEDQDSYITIQFGLSWVFRARR